MPTVAEEKPKEKIGAGIDRLICERRILGMQEQFNTWQPTMKDIKAYINPTRGFFDDLPNQGQAIDHKIQLDGFPRRCARTLGNGMTSGMTSPARPWFKLSVDDPTLAELDSVKDWLDVVQERMYNVYSRANIYSALTNVYEEEGSFGTACMLLTSDPDTVIRAKNFTIGEYWLSIGPDGRVNGFGRRYWLQVSALVKEFGIENVSEPVKVQYGKLKTPGNKDTWVSVMHLIEENDDHIEGSKHFKNMAFRSLQWEEKSNKDLFLRVGGYNRLPVVAPRWQNVTSSDIWSRSAPGWDALGDSKMLMKLQKRKMIGLDKTTNPPVTKDSMVGEVNTLPGGETITSSNAPDGGVRATYQIKFNLQDCLQAIKETHQAIAETFYTDLFMLLMNSDRRNITAREIAELHETKLLMLGPVLESQESELLDTLIEITYDYMWEGGLIPEPPPEMQGQEIKVEYVSILAQAQKMVGTTAIEQVANFVASLIAVWPEAKDKLDVDEAVDIYADMVGIPARIIRGAEATAKIRQATQEAMLKQQQAQAGMGMAKSAKDLSQAKLGSDANGQNSALDAVIAAMTGKAMPKNPAREKTGVA